MKMKDRSTILDFERKTDSDDENENHKRNRINNIDTIFLKIFEEVMNS